MPGFSLHRYFVDHAVLQRDRPLVLRGCAEFGTRVCVSLSQTDEAGAEAYVTGACALVPEDGRWSVNLGSHAAGTGYRLEVVCRDEQIVLEDICFGDVFILAGQSNMELPLSRCPDQMGERFRDYHDPLIREMKPTLEAVFGREADDWQPGGIWKLAQGDALQTFGALGLSFARRYREAIDVPVGLVMLAIGGTPIEAWLPIAKFQDEPELLGLERAYRDPIYLEAVLAKERLAVQAWHEQAMDDTMPTEAAWREIPVPGMFVGTDLEDYIGSLWIRRSFHLTADEVLLYEGGMLRVGSLVDTDACYLNDVLVGETGYRYPPRRYPLPAGVLLEGRNELVIRLKVYRGSGGIVPGPFYGLISGEHRYDLAGTWQLAEGKRMERIPDETHPHCLPASLYQGQVTPLRGFPFAGSLWYQGESNDSRPDGYEHRFRQLLDAWRDEFGAKTPFVYMQLTAYEDPARRIHPEAWALIREAQRKLAAEPGVAMVVTVDCGEIDDLHPQDKWTIGVRADLAMRDLQDRLRPGESGSGPVLRSIEVGDDSWIEVRIDSFDGVLEIPEDLILGLEVYDREHAVWARPETLRFLEDGFLVQGDGVRFNYEAAPLALQIRDGSGRPLSPFSWEAEGD